MAWHHTTEHQTHHHTGCDMTLARYRLQIPMRYRTVCVSTASPTHTSQNHHDHTQYAMVCSITAAVATRIATRGVV